MTTRCVRKFAVAASLTAAFFAFNIQIAAYPGQFDASYGTTGFYFDTFPIQGTQGTWFFDGEVTADGKFTAVGTFDYPVEGLGGAQDFYVQRLMPDGSRDTSFVGSFIGDGNAPGSVRFSNFFPIGSQSVARAVRIQQDNKIVIAGLCNIITGFGTSNSKQSGFGMCAARLNPSGSLDTSFGGNEIVVQHLPNDPASWFSYTMPAGTTFIHYPGQAETGYSGIFQSLRAGAFDVAVHSDGRVILAGMTAARIFDTNGNFVRFNHYATVVNLKPNGALSSSYKFAGSQTTDIAQGAMRLFYGVEALSNGNVVAVGTNPIFNDEGFAIASRWTVFNGSVGGTVTWESENLPVGARATAVQFTRDNKILVSGTDDAYPQTAGSMRRFLGTDLVPDTTFGDSGKIRYCRGNQEGCVNTRYMLLNAGTIKIDSIQPDGKILAVLGGAMDGLRFPFEPLDGFAIARFNPDGSVDRSFGEPWGAPPQIYETWGTARLHRETIQGVEQRIEYASFVKTLPDGRLISGGLLTTPGPGYRAAVTRRLNTFKSGNYSDLDDDGRSDIAVFRPTDGIWHHLDSFDNTYRGLQWGASGDKIAPADFDGDGRTDRAVFRNGAWYIYQSASQLLRVVNWGVAGDLPRPGDFNGDGFADVAVFRPSNGFWYILYSAPIQPGNVTFSAVQFGANGDIPMIGDYDGDGKSDVAVYRPSNGFWYIVRSTDAQVQSNNFGAAGDIPLNGDFNGDSRADLAVFRPSNGTWYVARPTGVPSQNFDSYQFGASGDKPVPGDYDNDGRTDLAVYRGGIWWIQRNSTGEVSSVAFGLNSDIPLQSAYQSSN